MFQVILFLCVCFTSLTTLQAQEDPPTVRSQNTRELPPGNFICRGDGVKTKCEYTPVNLSAKNILPLINKELFGDSSLLGSDKGYIFVINDTLIFSHVERLEEIKNEILYLDKYRPAVLWPEVAVHVELHSITDSGLQRFSLFVPELMSDPGVNRHSKGLKESGVGTLSQILNFGGLSFASLVSASMSFDQQEGIYTFDKTVPLYSELGMSQVVPVYISPTVGQVQQLELGLRVNGTVRLSSGDQPKISIEGFSVVFGKQRSEKEGDISVLNTGEMTLNLEPDVSVAILNISSVQLAKNRDLTLNGFSRGSGSEKTNLILIVRASISSHDQSNGVNREQDKSLVALFDKSVILEESGSDNISKIIQNVVPYAKDKQVFGMVLGFRLSDSVMPNNSNKDRQIRVSVEGAGHKAEGMRSVENLIVGGFTFTSNEIDPKKFKKSTVLFRVLLKDMETGAKSETYMSYNTQTLQMRKCKSKTKCG